ncbi:MAG: acyl-CoA thioesterase [Planctomycetaceae bacterium]|jgi:acyl-CoA thioester hydrolase|nr:acyl-CoA thioesterase [Planctomycetaceae bacterium]
MSLYEFELPIRVRYQETDQMGVVYHANYLTYFEMGRTEAFRSLGHTYHDMEASGLFCVVVHAECDYKKPAKYDDLLTLKVILKRVTRVKVEHEYRLYRGEELLATGKTTLAVVDRHGSISTVPNWMLPSADSEI